MRPHRRREPLQHVLIAGDVTEQDSIRALLALLPEDTYGQVLIESDDDLPDLGAPPRVTVTRIRSTAEQGVSLYTALTGWLSEWLPDEPDPAREVSVWVGSTVRSVLPTLVARLERL